MNILPSRYLALNYIMNAYNTFKIDVPLVCYDGTNIIPFTGTLASWTGSFDDIGIFVLIPKLIKFFGISVDLGINIFFNGLFYGSLALGAGGLFLLYKTMLQRCVTILALILFLKICVYASDVYIAYCAAILAVIPLFLYFSQEKKNLRILMSFLFLSGVFLGMLHYVRSYSSLPVLGFIMCYLLVHADFDYKRKLYLIVLLVSGLMVSKMYFDTVIKEYRSYAVVHFDTSNGLPTQHPFWHTIYAGFGFIKWLNKDNIEYDDGCVERAVNKDFPSIPYFQINEYEKIVKKKVIDLCRHQKTFVLMTLFAKLGVLLFYLLITANFGLLIAFFYPKPWRVELSFFIGFALSTLFPLIALPIRLFSFSFISFSTLYCIISINHFLSRYEKNIAYTMRNCINTIANFKLLRI